MRRGLIAVAVLVLVLVFGFLGATLHTNHRLGEQLVTDLSTLRAERIELSRPEAAPPPRHTNGLACLAQIARSAPTIAFSTPGDDGELAMGKKPISAMSSVTRVELDRLRPWVEAMRECGDAAELQRVEEVEVWSDFAPVARTAIAMRNTALDARVLLSEGHAARALQSCTEGLEVSLDQTHLGLLSALSASNSARMLGPICAEAWSQVTPEVRASIGPRWVLLEKRMASDGEVFELERIAMSITLFSLVASDASRARLPPQDTAFELTRLERLTLRRWWQSWDTSMRALAAADDEASFAAADRAVNDPPWWLPQGSTLRSGPGYLGPRARLENARAVLGVLRSIATGDPLPAQATEKDGVISLPAVDAENGALSFRR